MAADALQLETTLDHLQLEDGTGVLLLEVSAENVFIEGLHRIETGVVAFTAAGLGGVLSE